jgi:TolA-binding protein
VRSLLLFTAARIYAARGVDSSAIGLWRRIVEQDKDSPEAPQAELEWARLLRRKGDNGAAAARLEHLILTFPQSSLVPQARRELDLVRSAVPSVGGPGRQR